MEGRNIPMIDGHTRVCGLIGNPVEHTSSPAIHNTLAKHYGHNLVYVPFKVENGNVASAVKGAYDLNILGMNVTVPHKMAVMDCLCDVDELAGVIGAVNTLVRTDDGFKGYNTDILGLERALIAEDAGIENETVVVLGAGGAARSAVYLCERMKAAKVYVLNRSYEKAVSLAEEVNAHAGRQLVFPLPLSQPDRISEDRFCAIQATNVGLSPNDNDVVTDDPGFYDRVTFGFDLVYRPGVTRFMKLVNEHGGRSANGLKMLLYQGIIAYELWNDMKVDENTAMEVLKVLEETIG